MMRAFGVWSLRFGMDRTVRRYCGSITGNATLLSTSVRTKPRDSLLSSLAIACKDRALSSKSYADLALKHQLTRISSPPTKGNQVYEAQFHCIDDVSSYEHAARLGSQKVAELPNILLVNSLWDLSTSIAWKKDLRLQIPNYVLFLCNGLAAQVYLTYDETPSAMDPFLVTGKLLA
jgi:hypothetical protein